MLYLTALIILAGLATATIPVWRRMPRADRLLFVLVVAYVGAALSFCPYRSGSPAGFLRPG